MQIWRRLPRRWRTCISTMPFGKTSSLLSVVFSQKGRTHMDHPKFQWSVFVDNTRREQFVVRSDDIAEFLDGIEFIKGLLPEASQPAHEEPELEIPKDVCPIHNTTMKLRTGKNGGTWYDHRWQEGEGDTKVWLRCDG